MAYTPPADLPAPETLSPPDQITLGCFNNLTKVREETLNYWAAALNAVPRARLLL
jgi:predicted O-linked N-acetylglucosamine transferase (SPINDLY family)